MNNCELLVEVAPRAGRTKPGELDSIAGALAALCNCYFWNENKYKL